MSIEGIPDEVQTSDPQRLEESQVYVAQRCPSVTFVGGVVPFKDGRTATILLCMHCAHTVLVDTRYKDIALTKDLLCPECAREDYESRSMDHDG